MCLPDVLLKHAVHGRQTHARCRQSVDPPRAEVLVLWDDFARDAGSGQLRRSLTSASPPRLISARPVLARCAGQTDWAPVPLAAHSILGGFVSVLSRSTRRVAWGAVIGACVLVAGCGSSAKGSTAQVSPTVNRNAPVVAGSDAASATPAASADGASGAVAESGAPAVPFRGGVSVTDMTDGYSLDLPAKWRMAQPPGAVPATVSGNVGQAVAPDVLARFQSAFDSGVSLIALEPGTHKFAANVNMLVQPANSMTSKDLPAAVSGAKEQLTSQMHATGVMAKAVTVGVSKHSRSTTPTRWQAARSGRERST